MAFDKDAFLTALDSMSVMELNELVKAIEEKFGVSAAAMAAPAAGGGAAAPAAEEKTEFNVVLTDNKYQASQAFPLYDVYNFVFTHKFNDNLTYVADATYSNMENAPQSDGTTGFASWYGTAQYLIYKHNDQFTSNFRAEVFDDTKGARTGFRGVYNEFSYGLAYSPTQALIVRPTVRYDYNYTSRPFEGKRDLFTAAMDVIIRY